MPDDQKLSGPSFEMMTAGIRIGSDDVAFGAPVAADLGFEEIVVDSASPPEPPAPPPAPTRLDAQALFVHAQWGAAGQSDAQRVGRAKYRGQSINVSVAEPQYVIARSDDASQPAVAVNLTFSEAKAALQKMRVASRWLAGG